MRTYSLVIFFLLFTATGCVKEKSAAAPEGLQQKTASPCDGKTLCYTMNNEQYSLDAIWTEKPATITTPGYISISSEQDGGRFLIEFKIYSASPGHYAITGITPPQANDASLIYLDGAFGVQAYAGVVTITDIDRQSMTLTGNFYATAQKGDSVYKFAQGNFVDVPMK